MQNNFKILNYKINNFKILNLFLSKKKFFNKYNKILFNNITNFNNFYKIKKNKKNYSILGVYDKKIVGFRGLTEELYQIPKKKNKYFLKKGLSESGWCVDSKILSHSIEMLEFANKSKIRTSVCFGKSYNYYKYNNFKINDHMNRFIIPLSTDYSKFTKSCKFKNQIKKKKTNFFNWYKAINKQIKKIEKIKPQIISAQFLENLWKKISKIKPLFSRYRNKKFWEWRYLKCKYYKYQISKCPKNSGVIIFRIEDIKRNSLNEKKYSIIRIIEILPSNKNIWNKSHDKDFEVFCLGVLKWAQEKGCIAADYHLSSSIFNKFLFKIGFKLQTSTNKYPERALAIIFNPIKYDYKPINLAWKININKKFINNFIPYFVKSDGLGDFPKQT